MKSAQRQGQSWGTLGADDADFKAQPFVFDGFGGFGLSWLPIRKAIA